MVKDCQVWAIGNRAKLQYKIISGRRHTWAAALLTNEQHAVALLWKWWAACATSRNHSQFDISTLYWFLECLELEFKPRKPPVSTSLQKSIESAYHQFSIVRTRWPKQRRTLALYHYLTDLYTRSVSTETKWYLWVSYSNEITELESPKRGLWRCCQRIRINSRRVRGNI